MIDGRRIQEDGPSFRMVYKSSIALPGATYTRDIAIIGGNLEPHLFDAWCYVYNALRSYEYSKVVTLTEIETGETVTGEQLRKLMHAEE